jgi:hypothetical protein
MVFAVALVWSLGFLLFTLSWYLYFLAIVFGTFALFYFLGRIVKIRVVNQIILALFLGFLLGNLVSLAVVGLFSPFQLVSYLKDFSLQILNSVFSLFFPALAALLFVNLKQVTNAPRSAGNEQKAIEG